MKDRWKWRSEHKRIETIWIVNIEENIIEKRLSDDEKRNTEAQDQLEQHHRLRRAKKKFMTFVQLSTR